MCYQFQCACLFGVFGNKGGALVDSSVEVMIITLLEDTSLLLINPKILRVGVRRGENSK